MTDPNFRNTTLLLQADNAAGGAQNNTFLDSSSNSFAITRNGNTTQGTFTPFSQGWSNYFNSATPDYLTLSNNAAFDFGTSDVTIEAWVYITSFSNTVAVFSAFPASGTITGYTLFINTSGFIAMDTWVSGTEQIITTTNNALSLNTWNHIAYSRASGTSRVFVNGNSCTFSGSISQAINTGGNTEKIGYQGYTGFLYPFAGYISNVRVTKGGGLYTANFTPSTTPLTTTVSAGTVSLLTCQSNRFLDNSTNAFAITTVGSPSVQPFAPFAPQFQYTQSGIGGSGYFDGSGDYLSVASNAAFTLGTADFTLEFWLYPTSATQRNITFPTVGAPILYMNASSQLQFENYGAPPSINTTSTLRLNAWNHCVASRVSGTTKLFINGVEGVSSTAFSATNFVQSSVNIGTDAGTTFCNGYMADVRIVKGSGVTSVTVPTAPLTNITNTSLLTNFTNAGIIDGTMDNVIETVGNAQVSTSVVKYGSGSIAFDGTGDNLIFPATQNFNIFAGDLTIEFWAYFNSVASTPHIIQIGESSNFRASLYLNSSTIRFGTTFSGTGADRITGGTVAAGQWYHIALTKSGSTFTLWLNGVSQGTSTTTAYPSGPNQIFCVGFQNFGGASGDYLNGYIDDLRITKGVARYLSNFTPPQVALPRQ